MTEFDEMAAVRRIIILYRDRGMERTETDVKKLAHAICKQSQCPPKTAYDRMERDLLDAGPPPKLPPWPKRK